MTHVVVKLKDAENNGKDNVTNYQLIILSHILFPAYFRLRGDHYIDYCLYIHRYMKRRQKNNISVLLLPSIKGSSPIGSRRYPLRLVQRVTRVVAVDSKPCHSTIRIATIATLLSASWSPRAPPQAWLASSSWASRPMLGWVFFHVGRQAGRALVDAQKGVSGTER